MEFFLKFTLISYASIVFFALGFRLAFFQRFDSNFLKWVLIFIVVAVPLSFSFVNAPLQTRLFISVVWTSVIGIGFRFGRKIRQNSSRG